MEPLEEEEILSSHPSDLKEQKCKYNAMYVLLFNRKRNSILQSKMQILLR